MGFLDKAKAAAGQAAAKAKEEYDELQLKRELGQAYDALGKTAFELLESGELSHEQLDGQAAKIRELRQRLQSGGETETAEAEPVAADAEPETIEPPASPDEPDA
jgi:hypothetical protein